MKTGRMTWAGLVAYTIGKINICRILMGRPEGKRPIGRTRHQCLYNIKMGVKRNWMGENGLD
jgi:hypothetical protein